MVQDILLLTGLALALGFKHSYDADHLVAVSNLLVRSESLRETSLLSMSWAAGHMMTVSAISLLLYAAREFFLAQVLASLEILVAVMLVGIGALGLAWDLGVLHRHEHRHGPVKHRHVHVHVGRHGGHGAMFSIGLVHGVASNDELIILFVIVLGITSLGGLLFSVAVFSAGVVLGMVLFGMAVSYPVLRWGRRRVRRAVNLIAALLSIFYGSYLLAGLGLWSATP